MAIENRKSAKPIPTRASKAIVHAFAEKIAKIMNFKPGEPIEPLVQRLGGRIEYKNAVGFYSKQELPESIIVHSDRNFIIYIPSITSPERDRFTIAHELGHLFLHYPMVKQAKISEMIATRWVDDNDAIQQRAEWEANWFAAAFLMPETLFREIFIKSEKNMDIIAQKFGVSLSASEIRAKSLGLL